MLGSPKEQYLLIVMDTFTGQDDANINKLCLQNDCELIIVPHNLSNNLTFRSNRKRRSLSLINLIRGTQNVLASSSRKI